MLKNISKLGKELSKQEQRKITGGLLYCDADFPCPINQCCNGWFCINSYGSTGGFC
jgi:hypothetical protein